ncbi:MAG: TolC family protein [Bacteroidales bacterium]|nr:TolC family protein [Bacteroidales bacterium]
MKPFYFFILFLAVGCQHSAVSCQETVSSNVIDFRTAVDMMFENNATIRAAEKSTLLAKRQSQLINASWLPTITMTADYTMMSNGIGVSQDYASLLEPFKEKYAETPLVPEILNYISNGLGDLAFDVPIFEDDFGSIDLEILYPIFTGTKRLYANKLAKSNEALSEINKESVGAAKYLELANVYFSLSLAESMIKVLKETHAMTDNHYSQALKMEAIGMFDKAERFIVKVALDESERNLKDAENQAEVLREALSFLLGQRTTGPSTGSGTVPLSTSTPLFINEKYPQLEWFKDMMKENAYIFQQADLHDDIAKANLRLSQSNYYPVISLYGKQTIASYQVPKNMIPNTIGGVNLVWDIFDGLARERNIQLTKIESEIVAETQLSLKNDLEVAVDEWHANLRQACINAEELQSSLELAQEVYRIRKKSFSEGLCTSQQVLDALNLVNKTNLLLLTTYFEYDIARANLCCLCGIPEYFESFLGSGQ